MFGITSQTYPPTMFMTFFQPHTKFSYVVMNPVFLARHSWYKHLGTREFCKLSSSPKSCQTIMKCTQSLVALLLLALSCSANPIFYRLLADQPTSTLVQQETTQTVIPAQTTGSIAFEKREARKNKAIYNKEWLAEQNGESSTSETPKPWLRTIYSTKKEVVTPTVVAGVTFSAKPPKETDGLEPWISLKKDGTPVTVKPKLKNGQIKNGKPDLSTYFQTATTVIYNQKDLKAHNLPADAIHEEVEYIDEDQTYVSLNPLMRCTPDFYFKKGRAGHLSSEPFCTPKENTDMKASNTHFVTWYTRFFEEATNVRIHLAYIKESSRDKGMGKRDLLPSDAKLDYDSSGLSGTEGALPGTFYTSEWILNRDGFFALEVQEEWLQGLFHKKVAIYIQPDSVSDEDFQLLDPSNMVLVNFIKKSVVGKNSKLDRTLQDMGGTDDNVYYVVMTIPTMVIIAVFGMYAFLYINKGHRDLSHLRKPKSSRFGRNHHHSKYSSLPSYKNDVALDIRNKHS
ncbi:unnamed protein product [Kuraishia capsulata CBS 1993]|uniref:Uncharacterized protein n=1 Tax=Kuraishia capsulata CBS 1993 TaxID=1382522 RepID=W6MF98_9ASCO|nr:uncharacterized protein KUCA_T00000366001 [Kuraishia capsulata CBS 1993]CDK24404.1 unnamed protein product [Kuraishia capsulata CBS 1993]